MINLIDKGRGLNHAITSAGHAYGNHDGISWSTNDAVVQAIIDSYDPLPYEQEEAKKRLVEQFNESTKSLEGSYPEIEKRTFIKQENEARAYLLDSTVLTPTLSPISTARGLPLSELVDRVIQKSDAYTNEAAQLIGLRQSKEDLIDLETDWKIVAAINLMSV